MKKRNKIIFLIIGIMIFIYSVMFIFKKRKTIQNLKIDI